MGEFRVLTAISLPYLPDNYSTTVAWTASLHDPNGQVVTESGSVTLLLTPEPTSLILLAAGVATPLFWTLRRRRSA